MKSILRIGLAICLLAGQPATAFELDIVTHRQVNASRLLTPPPHLDSAQQQREMQIVVAAQRTRSAEQSAKAIADNELSFFRFDDVLGPRFEARALPLTTKFFSKITKLQSAILRHAKKDWNRPRPFETNADLKPIGEVPTSRSYPSGHAHFGFLAAIVLSQMVPEKAADIGARGREYGNNRIVAGVHYPSDVEAGQQVATATAAFLLADPTFRKDLAAARTELRRRLGYAD